LEFSRVELYAAIRRDRRVEGLSIRALADRYRVHRRTVRQALACAEPPPRKTPVRAAPKLDGFKPVIDAMLAEDLTAPGKQRHTAKRVFARLIDEHGATELSYWTVRDYVARRRPQIRAAAGAVEEGFVPQCPEPGAQAEVDFAECWVQIAGVVTKCHLFTFRLSYSGKAVHRVYATQGQEAFFEAHCEAFSVLGGVPWQHVRYDNLKPAVHRVCFGRNRLESARWVLLRSHFGFDAFYCEPGVGGAHEKGGVEGEGGRFRRQHLTPVPKVDSLAELNTRLAEVDTAEDVRRIEHRANTVGQDFAFEREALRPVPAERFDPGLSLSPRVDRYARISVRQCRYSVPARLIGKTVRVSLRASELLVFDRGRVVARHERLIHRGGQRLDLDHYLEILIRKPGALSGSTPLAQARARGLFTAAHQQFWDRAKAAHGDGAGTRALIEVLLLHRRHAHADVLAGITAALAAGSASPELVAIETRKAAAGHAAPGQAQSGTNPPGKPARSRPAAVVDLPARTRRALPADSRPAPDVAAYDQLLLFPGEETGA
jgi:transposase